jgi:hypothetical protein
MEHWRYFLALERDFERTIAYVEPCQANYGTYSIEYAKVLLGVGSEIDVVAKVMIGLLNANEKLGNINDYRHEIIARYPKFHTTEVLIPRHSIRVSPWTEWGQTPNPNPINPPWWRNYNLVKHQRHQHFSQANLENCLGALAGLYVLVLYLYHHQLFDHELNDTRLFALPSMPSNLVVGNYVLPDLTPATRGPKV